MKNRSNILRNVSLMIFTVFLLNACSTEESALPPVIQVFVNNQEVTSPSPVLVVKGERLEYRFEIMASATISDIKTVLSDLSDPASTTSEEVLVSGLANALDETVKGILFPTKDVEITLVVKDVDGNEVAKTIGLAVSQDDNS